MPRPDVGRVRRPLFEEALNKLVDEYADIALDDVIGGLERKLMALVESIDDSVSEDT